MRYKDEEYRQIRREIAEAEFRVAQEERLHDPLDVDRMIIDWERFTKAVESGYQGIVYE